MVDFGILYSDFTQVWKPISAIGDFRTYGVLTLSSTTERGNRSALVERWWSYQNNELVAKQDKPWWGEDIYYVGVMPNSDFFTFQNPEFDEKIVTFSGVNGTRSGTVDCPRTVPADATMHRFIGEYVEPKIWERALEVFETEMF